ncbi:MAG: sigma-70 family RNA polymerase sigma factor [Planctomycetota bacterium]
MSQAKVARYFAIKQPRLRAFVRSVVFNPSDVDDIVQDVAVIAIENADRFDGSRPVDAWVMGIAKNRVLKFLDKSKRQKLCFSNEAVDAIAAATLRPDDRSDTLDMLEGCLGKLEPSKRRLLKRRHEPGMTARELAKEIGYTDTRISRLLNGLYATLMQCVKDQTSES